MGSDEASQDIRSFADPLRMKIKLLLALFPRWYWLLVLLGLLFRPAPGLQGLSDGFINIFLFLAVISLGVILHEAGHLVAAQVMGGRPRRMVIGRGHEVWRRTMYGIKVIVNQDMKGGLATATFPQLDRPRLQFSVYVLGGIAANLGLALFAYILFGLDTSFLLGEDGIDVPSAFIAANVLLALVNLFPFHVHYQGIPIPSDGLNFYRTLTGPAEDFQLAIYHEDLFTALEYMEEQAYESARTIYERLLEVEAYHELAQVNLSIIELKEGAYEAVLTRLLPLLVEKERVAAGALDAIIFNNLAWTHLVLDNLDEAHRYAEQAVELNGQQEYILGTWGSVLISTGEIEKGVEILEQQADFDHVNSQTLAASVYLALGYHKWSKKGESDRHLSFVLEHQDQLGVDERALLERVRAEVVG